MTDHQIIEALRARPDNLSRLAAQRLEVHCFRLNPPPTADAVLAQRIINAVCRFYGRMPEEIQGPRRYYKNVEPRHVAMYLCRQRLKNNAFHSIGAYFEGRDHTTVMHAVESIERRLQTRHFRAVLRQICAELDREDAGRAA